MTSIIICGISKPTTDQKPPILVEKEVFCGECHQLHELEKCPECGAWIEIWHDPMSYLTNKYCLKECGWHYSYREGCMGNFIGEMFISKEQYEASDEYPFHCDVHDCHAWVCFEG